MCDGRRAEIREIIQKNIIKLRAELDEAWDLLIEDREKYGGSKVYLEDKIVELEIDLEVWERKYKAWGGDPDEL